MDLRVLVIVGENVEERGEVTKEKVTEVSQEIK